MSPHAESPGHGFDNHRHTPGHPRSAANRAGRATGRARRATGSARCAAGSARFSGSPRFSGAPRFSGRPGFSGGPGCIAGRTAGRVESPVDQIPLRSVARRGAKRAVEPRPADCRGGEGGGPTCDPAACTRQCRFRPGSGRGGAGARSVRGQRDGLTARRRVGPRVRHAGPRAWCGRPCTRSRAVLGFPPSVIVPILRPATRPRRQRRWPRFSGWG